MPRTAKPLSERRKPCGHGVAGWSIERLRQYEKDMLVVLGDKRLCSCGKPALENRWFCSEVCYSAIRNTLASALCIRYSNLPVDISQYMDYKRNLRNAGRGVEMKKDQLNKSEQIILDILQDIGISHATPIREEMDRRTHKTNTSGNLYNLLDQMQDKGYVRSWLGEVTHERGGRPKRYYEAVGPGKPAEVQATVLEDEDDGKIDPAEEVILERLLDESIEQGVKEEVQDQEISANGIFIV